MNKTIIIIISALMAFTTFTATAHVVTDAKEQTQKQKKAKVELKEVNFHVHLHCANCVKKVQDNIAFEKGVKDLHVTTHSILIKYDPAKTSEETLKAAVEKLGYKVLEEAHDHHHHN